ncbi:hypothetical protein [Enterobacter sp. TCD1-1]|uniref:hypothetical protein n=1 Tax=Enterobacter sp. TCD1-1 TaxID=1955625 RepID=UPI001E5E0123|nr:hypothetical protein [Enterobacter sp. TCD1-1]MCB5947092.1 hypothetical protein [Enterobacter sp. TCD1-1]
MATLKILARRASKIIYFLILLFAIGHILPAPESYINYDLARTTAITITGNENAESMYDAYSFIDWLAMLIITTSFYILTMKLTKKLRK